MTALKTDSRSSLATKLLKYVFGIYFLVALIVTSIQLFMEYGYEKDSVNKDIDRIITSFEPVLAEALWNLDSEALTTALRGMMGNAAVSGVTLVDETVDSSTSVGLILDASGQMKGFDVQGKELLNLSPEAKRSKLIHYEFSILRKEQEKPDKKIGIGIIYSDSAIVLDRVKYTLGLTVLNAVVKTCALWLIFFVVVRTVVSRPLSELTGFARRIAQGNFSAVGKLSSTSSDELGILNQSFVEMSEALESARLEQRKYAEELEKKVGERTAELSEALDHLKSTQNQLVESEKLASLGDLIAGVAHEVNTPIGICVTSASMVDDTIDALHQLCCGGSVSRSELVELLERGKEGSRMTLSNLKAAADIIRSFKQIAVDQSSLEKRTFKAKAYFEEVLLSLASKFKGKLIHILINCEEDLQVESFPGVFFQILTNLLLNSLIHGYDEGDRGTICIDLKPNKGGLLLTYSDDGKGIAKDNLNKIFDPFFTTNRGGGGSGLGLHIVYTLVDQQLNGTIRCESEVGKGTRFLIEFPSNHSGP